MSITPDADSTILVWRGMTVSLFPALPSYWVYLNHFSVRYKHAGHYTGMTGCLAARLKLHRSGNGARLMEVVSDAGIPWELARLWRFDSWEAAHAFESKLKRAGHAPRYCPICQHKPLDPYTLRYYGHPALSIHGHIGRRRPMATR